jgi:hypothetical protein
MTMRTGNARGVSSTGRLRFVPPPKKGLKLAGFRLRPDQIAALRREAHKRAQERGSLKPDASELVREALDAWLGKTGKKS